MDHEDQIETFVDAVLDGGAIDWPAAEGRADPATLALIRRLQLAASVARVHREILNDLPELSGHWGQFRLLERVGGGTSGEVFRARETRLDREVALKLMPAPIDQASAIIREGQLLAKVRHPNVVTIHGAAQLAGRVGLWMEFVQGQTLEQLLNREGAFRAEDVIGIGVELCRAVAAVHEAGLLHGDIKAQNVMRGDDGRIVLMDFGTGRELNAGATGDVAGTPLYLAPELLRGEPASAQSDVYSIGVLLYHLASGAYPVRADSLADLRAAHERGELVSLRAAGPAVPAGLARIVDHATDPSPARRFPTAAALGAALLGLQRHLRRKPWLYGAAVTSAIVLAGVAVWPRFGSEQTAPPRSPAFRSDIALPAMPAPAAAAPEQPRLERLPTDLPPPKAARPAGRPDGVRPSVQVTPLVNATGRVTDAWLTPVLAEMLLREFRGSEALRWIPGAMPLAKAQFGLAMGYTSSMVVRPVIPADVIVSGEYHVSGGASGGPLAVSLKVEDVRAGVAVTTLVENGTTEDLRGLVARLGRRARASLGASPLTAEQSAFLAASQPANAAAARAYTEGLARPAPEAAESAEEAIARDPRFAPAYILLAEAAYFRTPRCTESSPPDCVRNRELWQQKTIAAAAKARELSLALPREERILTGIRARLVEGGRVFEADYAKAARQLFDLFPDTWTYGYWVARSQERTKDVQGALATIATINRLPEAGRDVLVLQLEAQLARGVRDFKRAARALEQAAVLATGAGDDGLLAGIRNQQATVALWLGDAQKALAFAEEAIRLYAGNEGAVREVQQSLAVIYEAVGDFTRARAMYEQLIAFDKARSAPPRSGPDLRYALATMLARHGDLAEARVLLEELTRDWRSKSSPMEVCTPVELGLVLHRQGDLPGGLKLLEEAATTGARNRASCSGTEQLAWLHVEQGNLADARNLLSGLDGGTVVARVFLAAGDSKAARSALQKSPPLWPEARPLRTATFDLAMAQAEIALEDGRWIEARRAAQQAATLRREDGRPDDEAAARSLIALTWLGEGRVRDAREAITQVEQRLKTSEDRLLRLSSGVVAARVQAASGRAAEIAHARQRLQELVREAMELGAVAIALNARLALGGIEMRAGDKVAGRATLASLEREAADKGFVGVARRAAAARR
jgi:serine/threonine-protein kinase